MRHEKWTTRKWWKKIIAKRCQATGTQNNGSLSGKKSKNDWRRLAFKLADCWVLSPHSTTVSSQVQATCTEAERCSAVLFYWLAVCLPFHESAGSSILSLYLFRFAVSTYTAVDTESHITVEPCPQLGDKTGNSMQILTANIVNYMRPYWLASKSWYKPSEICTNGKDRLACSYQFASSPHNFILFTILALSICFIIWQMRTRYKPVSESFAVFALPFSLTAFLCHLANWVCCAAIWVVNTYLLLLLLLLFLPSYYHYYHYGYY